MDLGDGVYVDGSWELSVLVDDLQVTKRLRVSGSTHVGGLMLKLVEAIDVKMDWSDHGLWWPAMNCWLLKTRHTLDQCGVQADARLEFHRMHNHVRVQLPDLQDKELCVSFAQSVFGVVVSMCKDLGIRHPEELSLKRRDAASVTAPKSGGKFASLRRSRSSSRNGGASPEKRANRRSETFNPLVPKPVVGNGAGTLRSPNSPQAHEASNLMSPVSVNSLAFEGADESSLANSPHVPAQTAFEERGLQRLRSFAERAASATTWLDSSKSLMEQGFRPASDDELLLRFKFFAFYDLNIKYDAIRINQIYEQAKWSLLTEEVDCTEEEMFLLAGLQLQAHLQANEPQRAADEEEATADDEIDAALADLEMSLMSENYPLGSPARLHEAQQAEVLQVQELSGHLKFFKPKKFTLRNYKKYFFVLRDTTLCMYADEASAIRQSDSLESFNLKNAEAAPDINVTTQKFGIKLFLLGKAGHMQEVWLRCETKDQYARWMSGINLAARGKTLASRSLFDNEVKETLTHLELQSPKPQPLLTLDNMPKVDSADYVAPRFLKKFRTRTLLQGILERHANVRSKNLLEAKLEYIRTWQRLPMHGVAYFLVNYSEAKQKPMTFSEFRKQRQQKQELFGVAFNRIMRLDPQSGDTLNTWRYHELASWTVNWELLNLRIRLNRPPHEMSLNPCPFAASKQAVCKTLAEFVGGYVFLSLRKPEKSQQLDEALFHKLTASADLT